jgi:hypothetical protein
MRKWIASLAVLTTALVAAVPLAGASSTTCTGELAPGSYHKLIVPEGAVCGTEAGPVTIRGGLYVRPGATLVLGSEENPVHTATISGGVHASDAMSVQIHFSTISGGVQIAGGSGPFGGPFEVTWNTLEDNVINGSVWMTGYNGFWEGFFRNTVHGSVNYENNTLVDPDGNEVQSNTIFGNLNCFGNDPAPQQGDSGGVPNVVTGQKTGQCVGV